MKSQNQEGNQTADETGSASQDDVWTVFSVRMRASEVAELDALCAELGVKRNRVLRTLVLKANGFLDYDKETTDVLRNLTRQISGMATNINQLAKQANKTSEPDFIAFMEDRKGLGALFSKVETQVQILLNVRKRKAAAKAILEKALGNGQ
ncbi:DNA mobilization endonuclease VirD1/MobC family subunit [Roseibium sediminicola]|uniref:DNA mobilization endonuclease VirD1/MobC family subunit n=1 Tax=Roseibium sediminicola TaxID=2933272 RepID=A0ABT0H2N7_9HYPH|nr:DNA mobilization endonuclease VirD1/MobC family subunit [Roseibium sp. CAU 1639]MCK7615931.1 DNA mobilization endonuclease VirD1/MobC family subunit [Roseibium sp. CAU 1639]